MSKLDWIKRAAFGAGIILVIVTMAVYLAPVKPTLIEYVPIVRPNEHYQAGGEHCKPDRLAGLLSRKDRVAKTGPCEEAAEDHRLKTDDLIQQTRAAQAVEESTTYAFDAVRLGFVQAVFSLLAVIFTAWAAMAASSAAAAANSAVTTARELSKKENRPWLGIFDFTVDKYHFAPTPSIQVEQFKFPPFCLEVTFRVLVENTGNTPALNISYIAYGISPDAGQTIEKVQQRPHGAPANPDAMGFLAIPPHGKVELKMFAYFWFDIHPAEPTIPAREVVVYIDYIEHGGGEYLKTTQRFLLRQDTGFPGPYVIDAAALRGSDEIKWAVEREGLAEMT